MNTKITAVKELFIKLNVPVLTLQVGDSRYMMPGAPVTETILRLANKCQTLKGFQSRTGGASMNVTSCS